MSEKSRSEKAKQIDRALDRVVDDLFSASDDDVLKEMAETQGSVDEGAARFDRILVRAIGEVGSKKLAAARAAVRALLPRRKSKVIQLPIAEKRLIIEQFAVKRGASNEKLTAAARNAVTLDETEVDGMLEDLLELGAIDERGNPR